MSPGELDLIYPDVVADLLGVGVRQVQRMVERGQLQPYAYVQSLRKRFMVFERGYILEKKEKFDALRAAKAALDE